MELIHHLVGTCSDTHTHIDLIDLILMGGGSISIYVTYIKTKFNFIFKLFNKVDESGKTSS